jgi:protein gp37
MKDSKIEWTDSTWNPITGCTPVSAGCQNCYAKSIATRFKGTAGYPKDDPFKITFHPKRLEVPLRWKKPKRIFVCSMADLFHPNVSDEDRCDIFTIMQKAYWHTFMILTKRPRSMRDWINDWRWKKFPYLQGQKGVRELPKNIWVGTTAENQAMADQRIPALLDIPAVIRFVSIEPMLEEMDVSRYVGPYSCYGCGYIGGDSKEKKSNENMLCPECLTEEGQGVGFLKSDPGNGCIDWVIVGGESGPKARYMNPDWARSIRDQCKYADVQFFFKKLSGRKPGPEDLMIREFPLP